MKSLKLLGHAAAGMLWPRLCCVCGESLAVGEEVMCLGCLVDLPRFNCLPVNDNAIHERLIEPRLPVDRALAWFHYYRDSGYAAVIHDAKYRGMPRLARYAARMMAHDLAPHGAFDDIDVLVPVPMAWRKEWKRGYNQAVDVAKGLSDITGLPVAERAMSVGSHATQTRRGAWMRWLSSQGLYRVARRGQIAGRRVMLVDDVITSGSTMIHCLRALRDAGAATLSVAALAATHKR